ncbi:TfoX/Sxy family protein [Sphingomonas piscis]|uniref:TfoX/Sxy family protein n=1 Tax=Sphingomonas piscis TaxID=2714943 RepID=A0A6G7YSB2_9SPHN|nr:TfoX/Sxy family protein [Sphingomonas piscis]
MAFDAPLAHRVRRVLSSRHSLTERKMMGALCFMVDGHMACGVTGSALMVRTGPDAYLAALAEPGVKPMEIGGRPTKGFVLVDQNRLKSNQLLKKWVQRGLDFVTTLPSK